MCTGHVPQNVVSKLTDADECFFHPSGLLQGGLSCKSIVRHAYQCGSLFLGLSVLYGSASTVSRTRSEQNDQDKRESILRNGSYHGSSDGAAEGEVGVGRAGEEDLTISVAQLECELEEVSR